MATHGKAKELIPLLGITDASGQLFENIDEIGDDLVITSSNAGAKTLDIQAESDTKSQKGPNIWLTRGNTNPQKGGYGGAIWWQTNNDAGEMVDYANMNLVISNSSNGSEDGTAGINGGYRDEIGVEMRKEYMNDEDDLNIQVEESK